MKPISKDLATTELKRGSSIVAMPRYLGKGHPIRLQNAQMLRYYSERYDFILMLVN